MRRIALVLTLAMLMAVTLLSAGPAKADIVNSGNTGGWANQQFVVIVDDGWSDGHWWDGDDCCHYGWWSHGGGGWWDGGDIELSSGDIEFS